MLEQDAGQDPELRAEALRSIREGAEMQARLVEDLMDTARVASGHLRVEVRPVVPTQLVRAAVGALAGRRPLLQRLAVGDVRHRLLRPSFKSDPLPAISTTARGDGGGIYNLLLSDVGEFDVI